MKLTPLEQFIQDQLVEFEFPQNEFGVVSVPITGGSCNLTYVIDGIIKDYHKKLIASLGEPLQINEYKLQPDENGVWWMTHMHVGSGEPLEQFFNS